MHFMYQCLLVYMVPNACLYVQLREDVQTMNDHPCSPCSQPVHVQGWGGGAWEHWWFYPTPCSASSPCQATQFITNSALTWEVYDAAAAFLSHNHHHPVGNIDDWIRPASIFSSDLSYVSIHSCVIVHFPNVFFPCLFLSLAGWETFWNICDWIRLASTVKQQGHEWSFTFSVSSPPACLC